ncbi:hypothetical protein AB0399_10695 [Streptomyces sp. NPDC088194]|uniref:hypothetical protein n=1 Tax=Streptomyces sp. NPDC088194 TaxID=3154931 RepID=UPI00344CEE45
MLDVWQPLDREPPTGFPSVDLLAVEEAGFSPAGFGQAGRELRPAEVLDLYLEATTACGGAWTSGALRAALRAYAAATGLENLHGLDR